MQSKQRVQSGRRLQNFKADPNLTAGINSRYTRMGPTGSAIVDSEGAKLRKVVEDRKRKQKMDEAKQEIAMIKNAKDNQKETMKKISNDYKSVDKMNAQQQKKPLVNHGKHLNYAAGKIPLNSLTTQDKLIHRQNSNKRIIINDSEKRK